MSHSPAERLWCSLNVYAAASWTAKLLLGMSFRILRLSPAFLKQRLACQFIFGVRFKDGHVKWRKRALSIREAVSLGCPLFLRLIVG
jgi:hypothetical protein